MTERPERELVRRALAPGAAAVPVAFTLGWALGGAEAAWSAAVGIVAVIANFAAHGLSLAWASRVSLAVVHAVALGGFVARLGALVGVLFALSTLDWFSPMAFALTVVPATMLLLGYEAWHALHGVGAELEIPADRAAAKAASAAPRELG